MSHVKH